MFLRVYFGATCLLGLEGWCTIWYTAFHKCTAWVTKSISPCFWLNASMLMLQQYCRDDCRCFHKIWTQFNFRKCHHFTAMQPLKQNKTLVPYNNNVTSRSVNKTCKTKHSESDTINNYKTENGSTAPLIIDWFCKSSIKQKKQNICYFSLFYTSKF